MHTLDWVLLALVVIWFAAVLRTAIRRRGGCGHGSSCFGCAGGCQMRNCKGAEQLRKRMDTGEETICRLKQ